jgi:phospholipase C
VLASTDPSYPSQVQGTCRPFGQTPNLPNASRCTADAGTVGATAGPPNSQSRINVFQPQFQQQVANGTVPRFNYLILFNDHTDGTTPGTYTPKANVADNDLALGQLVQLVSQSSIWSQSAIFVMEDDSQDGIDSVDAHRIPAFVISPWAKRGGAVISTRYDHYSFLRTAEMISGLLPLSLNDALATPLYDAFISGSEQPDVQGTRYTAIQPTQSMTETNPANAPGAAMSKALPWDKVDAVPQRISDELIWQSVFGAGSVAPPAGPNHSPEERARATGALRLLRHGKSARAYLLKGG